MAPFLVAMDNVEEPKEEVAWQEKYEDLLKKNLDTKELNNFLSPLYEKYNAQNPKNMAARFRFSFYKFEKGKFIQKAYYRDEIELSPENPFVTIGRHPATTISLPQSHSQISRVHAMVMMLPDNDLLFIDLFSACGTELLESPTVNFQSFVKAQRECFKNPKIMRTYKLSSTTRNILRMGLDLIAITYVNKKRPRDAEIEDQENKKLKSENLENIKANSKKQ